MWGSARLAVIGWGGREGQGRWLPARGLPLLVPSLTTRTPNQLQLSTGRGWSSGRKRLSKPTPRVTAEPHPGLAKPHIWMGGQVMGFILRDRPVR